MDTKSVPLTADEKRCMVATFSNSQAAGKVPSKSVTSCTGMTAHQVLLAQISVGFLSGGRGKRMRDLTPTEFLTSLKKPMQEPPWR